MTEASAQPQPDFLILADLEQPFSFHKLFGNNKPVELEIGAGRGDFLVGYCKANPQINVAAVERKINYLKRGINKARQMELANVRFLNLEVTHFLEEYAPAQSLQAVHIYFPDPWPKKRHLRRRLIQPEFIMMLAGKIVPGGGLHLRTDHTNYFEHMMEVMANQQYFTPVPVPEELSRHKTGFERRFIEDGIPINYASYILK